MLLNEFESSLRTTLVAVLDKIKNDMENGIRNSDITVSQFIKILKNNGIDELDEDDLYDMV
jgi:hypothetical protein